MDAILLNLSWGKLISGVSLIGIGLTACAIAAVVIVGACAPLTILARIPFAAVELQRLMELPNL